MKLRGGVYLISRVKETYKKFTFFVQMNAFRGLLVCIPWFSYRLSRSLLSLALIFSLPLLFLFSLFLLIFSPYFFPYLPLSLLTVYLSLSFYFLSHFCFSLSLLSFSLYFYSPGFFLPLCLSLSFSLSYQYEGNYSVQNTTAFLQDNELTKLIIIKVFHGK